MKINNLLKAIITVISLLVAGGCFGQSDWDGEYRYETAMGTTAGGSPISMVYNLSIEKAKCMLKIDGFQVDDRIRCQVVGINNVIKINFTSL